MSEANGERSTRQSENKRAISRDRYDAVLLDLDGVITDTASVHAACWKQMFDEYLQKRATQRGEVFHPFEFRRRLPAICGWEASLRRCSRLSHISRYPAPRGNPGRSARR